MKTKNTLAQNPIARFGKSLLTRQFVLLILSMGLSIANAQEAVLSTGGNASGAGGSASYSVGQVADASYSGANGSSHAGVQQPFEFFVVGLDENENILLSMSLFPNPAQTDIILAVEKQSVDNLSYEIFDVSSKIILNQKISSAITQIPTQDMKPGTYFLRVLNSGYAVKTFTLIKND